MSKAADAIAAFKVEKGVSQIRLAPMLGVSSNTLSRVSRGVADASPHLEMLLVLALRTWPEIRTIYEATKSQRRPKPPHAD